MSDDVKLRPFTAEDNAGALQLIADSPDTGAITFRPVYKADLSSVYAVRRPRWQAVLAEHSGKAVGLGVVALEELQIEGALHPAAYFFSLVVHPDYRHRGIARRLAQWRLNYAREQLGDDVVIYANIQRGNSGSVRTAAYWSSQFIGGQQLVPFEPLLRAPQPDSRCIVRQAQENDLEQLADKLNRFYADFNLYQPQTASALREWLEHTVQEHAVHQYWIVLDTNGDIRAGVGVTHQALYMEVQVERMPAPLRILNQLLHVVPTDGRLRQLDTSLLWYEPMHLDAARYLWQSVRYEVRESGNTILCTFDPRSPIMHMITPPRFIPRAHLGTAIYAPFQLRPDRPLYVGI